jgi:hypothetical protein
MNPDREIDLVLSTWLGDGPTGAPDRVLDVLTDRIARQPQRPTWRLDWRHLHMTTTFKLATAAVAVAVVAFLGYNLLPSSSAGTGGPTASPSASPSPSPSPLAYTWPGALAAGTYSTTFVWDTSITATFTVPDGWESRDVEIIKDPVSRLNEVGGPRGMSIVVSPLENVYMDPCGAVLREPSIGPSVRDAADGLVALPGIDVTAPPTATRFAGHEGLYLEFSVPDPPGCPVDQFRIFSVKPEWMRTGLHSAAPYFYAERQDWRVWVLDMFGTRYVVAALTAPDVTAADRAELQGIIDSISFDSGRAPSSTAAPQPAP